jgi:hypothetical protein
MAIVGDIRCAILDYFTADSLNFDFRSIHSPVILIAEHRHIPVDSMAAIGQNGNIRCAIVSGEVVRS